MSDGDIYYLQAPGYEPGTTKDWIAQATPFELTIYYGKTGTKLRKTVIPQNRCYIRQPDLELTRRMYKKIDKGYHRVENAMIPDCCDFTTFKTPKKSTEPNLFTWVPEDRKSFF
jgi:hypothetical protein